MTDQVPEVGGATAADSVEAMAERLADEKIRSTLGEYEKQLADMMAKAERAFADQQSQLDAQRQQLAGQIAAVRAQAGPPEAVTLAASLAQRVQSIADANPDLPVPHMAGVRDQGKRLSAAVQAAAGSGEYDGDPLQDAERLANGVITWFTRSHPRVSGKFLEGAGEVVNEAERILDLLPELAPVVQAVAAAV